jgi:hypothetical protein
LWGPHWGGGQYGNERKLGFKQENPIAAKRPKISKKFHLLFPDLWYNQNRT